ncbi:MAG: Sensor protein resE, partial [Berkelbacteria bacterium GW2011_GWB1_38_5]
YLIGAIVAFALLYYLVIYKYFSTKNRRYVKAISDIVLIGVLIHILKDYGQYFFALYFLPIAAAAMSLQFFNALFIATIASLFVVFEIVLSSQNLLPKTTNFYEGAWQIALILLVTIFCRFLALQLKEEEMAKEMLQEKQKLMELEAERQKEFLSLTSHQLYTPLSMIRGFVSMLADENFGKLNPGQKEATDEIYANTKRVISLVSELLSISRIQTGTFTLEKKKTDISSLIENTVKQFKATKTNDKITINYKKPAQINTIDIDADKIRNCLYNLIDNALKYTKEGEIKITCKQDDSKTLVEISDQGTGVKQEDFEKLFQPFFRGKNILELDNQGTGLGLYITRLIIEKHQGKVIARNNHDKGATFGFELPNNI